MIILENDMTVIASTAFPGIVRTQKVENAPKDLHDQRTAKSSTNKTPFLQAFISSIVHGPQDSFKKLPLKKRYTVALVSTLHLREEIYHMGSAKQAALATLAHNEEFSEPNMKIQYPPSAPMPLFIEGDKKEEPKTRPTSAPPSITYVKNASKEGNPTASLTKDLPSPASHMDHSRKSKKLKKDLRKTVPPRQPTISHELLLKSPIFQKPAEHQLPKVAPRLSCIASSIKTQHSSPLQIQGIPIATIRTILSHKKQEKLLKPDREPLPILIPDNSKILQRFPNIRLDITATEIALRSFTPPSQSVLQKQNDSPLLSIKATDIP